ncbi:MAG: glycosyl hydrolase 108 family protein [Sediminibacterium sp.]|uniref:glycosyl hydrolase 108 family protein n=1 Tax=Sediminibacterium sp. TaxID=1917865 RepID=UPI003A102BF0
MAPTLYNLQHLTDDQTKTLYKKLYWDPIHADQIIDGDLRFLLFDFFVNSGGNAVKVLQRTINETGGAPVAVDGVMGANTLNAINAINPITLYNNFKSNCKLP